jgi:hypothetical protein
MIQEVEGKGEELFRIRAMPPSLVVGHFEPLIDVVRLGFQHPPCGRGEGVVCRL